MIPVEPISLSISAVALATLFSSCLECFDYFQSAKSFANDLDLLLAKLDCQKERLLTWGDLVGISKSIEEGRHPDLDSSKGGLIHRCLHSIESLFSSTDKLRKEYGVESTTAPFSAENSPDYLSSNRMDRFRKSYLRIRSSPTNQSRGNILSKTKWAIHDKAKFEALIYHIKDLTVDIHNIIPVSARSQDKMVHKDIASLALPRLRLVQNACEGTYQNWSDVASAILMASEAGTIDRRSVREWLQDTKSVEHDVAETTISTDVSIGSTLVHKGFDLSVSSNTKFYFVFTSGCFSNDSETYCQQKAFGLMSLKQKGESFLPGLSTSLAREGTLGRRITKSMNVKFDSDDLEMLRQANYDVSDFQKAAIEANLPLGNVYVYCAPCACAVRTALTVCVQGSSKYLPYKTRVDDRICASCCPETTKMDRLISLVTTIKEIEAALVSETSEFNTTWVGHLDRVWIEQRVYRLEEEIYAQNDPRSRLESGAELLTEFAKQEKATGIVFLGELDYCQWMLQTQPFPWKARVPKETEIYQLEKTANRQGWDRKYLGTFTPKNFTATATYLKSGTSMKTPKLEAAKTLPSLRPTLRHAPPNLERQDSEEQEGIDSKKNPRVQASTSTPISKNSTGRDAKSELQPISEPFLVKTLLPKMT